MPKIVIALTCLLLLMAAVWNFEILGYYEFLRIYLTGIFVWATVIAVMRKEYVISIGYGIFALLYNPIVPVHTYQYVWMIIDFIALFYLLATMDSITPTSKKSLVVA